MKLYAKAVWEGIEYNSVEDCEIYEIETGYSVRSLITGTYNNIFYKVAYQINTSRSWVLTSFEVKSEINGKILIIHAHKDPAGKWIFPQDRVRCPKIEKNRIFPCDG